MWKQLNHPSLGVSRRDLLDNRTQGSSARVITQYNSLIVSTLDGVHNGATGGNYNWEADRIAIFEGALARAFSEPGRSVTQVMQQMRLSDLRDLSLDYDWSILVQDAFREAGVRVTSNDVAVVQDVPYFVEAGRLIAKTDDVIIQNYVAWRYFQKYRFMLGRNGPYATFGLGTLLPYHCQELITAGAAPLVGRVYVDSFDVSKTEKEYVRLMASSMKDQLKSQLSNASWIDSDTKITAMRKVDQLDVVIGYEEWILSDNELDSRFPFTLDDNMNPLYGFFNFSSVLVQENLKQLRMPALESHDLTIGPSLLRSTYDQSRNRASIPTALLQGFLFLPSRPAYMNFASIGSVISNSILHSLDDEGRHFDENGNLRQWWSEKSERQYIEKQECFIDQYGSVRVFQQGITTDPVNLKVNGRSTLSENLADNAGIRVAFATYRDQFSTEKRLTGLKYKSDQLFFITFAGVSFFTPVLNF